MRKQKIQIKEVGPRDGLQNEDKIIETADKIEWIDRLSNTGLTYIEITSFVHPKWIPQLSDAREVAKAIKRYQGITYAALVPNMKGLDTALEANIDEVSVFMSASESHNQANINKSIIDTFPILEEVVQGAIQGGKTARGYISTAFGCPYEGEVPVEQVFRICDKLLEMGVREVSLGDTIGAASPNQIEDFLELALKRYKSTDLALHFHDTRGMALANVLAALDYGIETFDAALGGLGGCPYAPGASGNAATEDLVQMLNQMNINTGIDIQKLLQAGVFMRDKLQKNLPSHMLAAYTAQINEN